ncbi:MAG: aspartyl protease family protein [Bacteroidales bacterium]|nr:aspartyl protease family protein [Bacteroidales bacterium]
MIRSTGKYFIKAAVLILSFIAFSVTPSSNVQGACPAAYSSVIRITTLLINTLTGNETSLPDSVIIPLKRSGRLFFIETTIDGVTGNLVFDSGAMGLVLNKTYFRDYAKSRLPSSGGATGLVAEVSRITADRIQIGDLVFKNSAANMVDLSHIENRRGLKVLGLLGLDNLRNFEMIIDLRSEVLQLYPIDKKGQRLSAESTPFQPDYMQEIEVVGGVVFVKVTIAGKMLRFCLDSAAETNALSKDAPKAVMETFSLTRTSLLRGAGTQTKEVLLGNLNDISIGEIPLHPMTALLSNLDQLGSSYSVHLDGILGFDFFIKGMIRLNFVTREMSVQFYQTEEK